MERPVLDSKMARWVSTLAAYDLQFVQRKAVKGGAIADQLAELPVEDEVRDQEFPDKEILALRIVSGRCILMVHQTIMEMGSELYSKLLVENTSLSLSSWTSNAPTTKLSMK